MELKRNSLTKCCGQKAALDSFSHTFRDGICGILGATGAVNAIPAAPPVRFDALAISAVA